MSDVIPESVTTNTSPALDAPGEGCPTPLAWQEVLEAVRQEGTRHQVDFKGGKVTATSLGAGAPLYLLPGFLGDHEQFILLTWLLREECCCVMLDPPVDGSEHNRSAEARLAAWSLTIRHLADRLGHERIRLHGCGFGGFLGLQILRDAPDRISAASLQGAFGSWKPTLVERGVLYLGRRTTRTLGEIASVMQAQTANHRHWFPPFDGTRWEFFAGNLAATPAAEAAQRADVARGVDLIPSLDQISQPVLIVRSEGDGQTMSAAQSRLADHLPQARVEILDNCGRVPHITHPHRLVKLLRTFWEQTT